MKLPAEIDSPNFFTAIVYDDSHYLVEYMYSRVRRGNIREEVDDDFVVDRFLSVKVQNNKVGIALLYSIAE